MDTKIAIITGASRGIGKTVAKGLAQDGYTVCLLSRTKSSLEALAQEIESKNGRAFVYACDVGDEEAVENVVNSIVKQFGRIDLLFNNAGILHKGTLTNTKHFLELLQINLVGAFHLLKAVVPHMKNQKSGYIFNLASVCGKIGYPDVGAYTASKFGLVGLSESLFHELAPYHVKVTTLCPSYVLTDMVADVIYPTAQEMIQTEDILEIMRGLLKISAHACVKELVIDCRATLIDQA